AINYYTVAINESVESDEMKTESNGASNGFDILYTNRAMCLFFRKYHNDLAAASEDCESAIRYNPNHVKAYYWNIRCLHGLKNYSDSIYWCKRALRLFPQYKEIQKLYDTILQEQKKNKATAPKKRTEENDKEKDKDNDVLMTEKNASDKDSSKHHSCTDNYTSKYKMYNRYIGHCNLKTDIKEAAFFGRFGEYLCSGSDDGRCYIWERSTGKLVNILPGVDERVVNCVRGHPFFPVLAMSGIDATVKMWTPNRVAPGQLTSSAKDKACEHNERVENTKVKTIHSDEYRTHYQNHLQSETADSSSEDDTFPLDEDTKQDDNNKPTGDSATQPKSRESELIALVDQNQQTMSREPEERVDFINYALLLNWLRQREST
ncbi:hypothetical protein RFI_11501, partial [Reticulomyxa filosa]